MQKLYDNKPINDEIREILQRLQKLCDKLIKKENNVFT